MGTKILEDIHNDLKLLIKSITGFEDDEEGFILCERYALSQIKHHRYLSVNSNQIQEEIKGLIEKFQIHGNYEVANKFQELVNSFLENFNFARHPQYDIQWSLLSLLLNLATETSKSSLINLEQNLNAQFDDDNKPEDIDWAQYLKDDQKEFFHDFGSSSSESSLSNEDQVEDFDSSKVDYLRVPSTNEHQLINNLNTSKEENVFNKLSQCITTELVSKKWLASNVQYHWWNELNYHQHQILSSAASANLCEFWHERISKSSNSINTISEYQACRELIWMFYVQEPMAIFQSKDSKEFSVRKGVSIPSLSSTTFENILLDYCHYLKLIKEFDNFEKILYSLNEVSKEYQRSPLTFEAYNAAVQQYLLDIKNDIVKIEKRVISQETPNTFLTIARDLQKYLKFIQMLHEIHRSVTDNWELFPNWIRTPKLLSNLYHEMQNSSSHKRMSICANLYLSSITVYLNMIDVWLKEGRLEDWRDEFVIVKELRRRSQVEEKEYREFIVRELDETSSKDPMIQFLLRKVCQMGRSIELLVTLDRLSDIWDSKNDSSARKISLSEEFRRELLLESSKYDLSLTKDTVDTLVSGAGEIYLSAPMFDESILNESVVLSNPFFMKAFESFLPVVRREKNIIDQTDSTFDEGTEKSSSSPYRLKLISKSILPLGKVFENVLSRILDSRYISTSKLVKDIMIEEYKLKDNLRLMRSVYTMERGHVMNKFCNMMFNEIESNVAWRNSHFLSTILEEVISEEWPDLSSRWSITIENLQTHHVLRAVDGITLNYAVDWPINMLLNEDTLSKYNSIFRFGLRLKWALWTLNNLRFAELEGSKLKEVEDAIQHFHMRRLECLRFWLLHTIGAIQIYLCGQVLHSLGNTLENELAQAESLDSIIKIHKEYLNKVREHCLQTSQFDELMSTINKLLEICLIVRDTWKNGFQNLEGKKLDLLESTYIKYHTYLALALHNAVQHHNATYYKLASRLRKRIFEERKSATQAISDHVLDMSQNLLTEVAYQNLPPSGLPFPISILIKKRLQWKHIGMNLHLFEYLPLNECEQKFSLINIYYKDRILGTSSSPFITFKLSQDSVDESDLNDLKFGVSESSVLNSNNGD